MKNRLKVSSIGIVTLLIALNTYAQPMSTIDIDYPKEEKAVRKVMNDIFQSVKKGDVDKLISYHAYSPQFTEFKQGAPRNGSLENEKHERNVFGSVSQVVKMEAKDMKVAVYYGNVANVTLHSDFQLKFGEDLVVVNDQITLLFVKDNNGDWKIVHEHHSPLLKE